MGKAGFLNDNLLKVTIPSSVLSGFLARLICHPLDTVKARMQMFGSTSLYGSTLDVVRDTLKHEGVRGFYRGLPAAAVGSAPAVCIYISGYEFSKKTLMQMPFFAKFPFAADFSAGMAAETLSCIIFVPVDVVKERLQIQRSNVNTALMAYNGSLDALVTIMREEGLRGIYKGYGATLLSFGPFSACYFLFYEQLKKLASATPDASGRPSLSPLSSLLCASGAGATASVLTNPLDLVKLRLQVQRRATMAGSKIEGETYKSFAHGLASVMAKEGWRGMLRGAGARVAFHVPNTACTFTLYEQFKKYFAARKEA